MVGCCEHGNECPGSIKWAGSFLSSSGTVSFSRRTLLHGVSVFSENTVNEWS
jgi:hypothetical protein